PCNGRLDRRRCTACVLAQRGVPSVLRDVIARTPPALGDALGRAGLTGGAFTALRLSSLIGAAHRRLHELMRKADHVVAPCDWVREALLRNGVPEGKVMLCRQGLAQPPARLLSLRQPDGDRGESHSVLRLGYFGRLDPTKGVDILVEALRRVPEAPVRL